MKVIVRRSSVRMWLIALGAVPLLIVAVDVITNRRITTWLTELLFRPEDIQIYEPRDVIFAWTMFLFAGALVLWGLKELFLPTKIIEGRDEGLAMKLSGPFRKADVIPWSMVVDIRPGEILDEGDQLPLLLVELLGRGELPEHPWGARWIEARTLGVLAQDWSVEPADVSVQLSEFAVDVARREARARTARIWKES